MIHPIYCPGETYHPYDVWGGILEGMPIPERDRVVDNINPETTAQWEQIYQLPCHDHILPRFP